MEVPEVTEVAGNIRTIFSPPSTSFSINNNVMVTVQACYWWCLYSQKLLPGSQILCRFNLSSSEDARHRSVHQPRVCSHVNYIQLYVPSCISERLGYGQQLLMFCNVIMFGKTTAVLFCSHLLFMHSCCFLKKKNSQILEVKLRDSCGDGSSLQPWLYASLKCHWFQKFSYCDHTSILACVSSVSVLVEDSNIKGDFRPVPGKSWQD